MPCTHPADPETLDRTAQAFPYAGSITERRASFVNQPIEVGEPRGALADAGVPQLLLRFGYGPAARPSPRRPLGDVLFIGDTP